MALVAATEAAAPELHTSHRVAESLADGARLHTRLQGRYVTVVRHQGKLYCIDSVCFHAGGPLGVGDVEDVNGQPCLVCPWHYYKIDMATGDKYYQQLKFVGGKMSEGDWTSNGVKQRTHRVEETSEGAIVVTLCAPPPALDSDEYACMASCGERVLQGGGGKQGGKSHGVGADGKKPSGAVLQAARAAAAGGRGSGNGDSTSSSSAASRMSPAATLGSIPDSN